MSIRYLKQILLSLGSLVIIDDWFKTTSEKINLEMEKSKKFLGIAVLVLSMMSKFSPVFAQRLGGLPRGAIVNKVLISDGPKGPIQGGESAVTDMVLLTDGWVYGSTKATWGAEHCHLFRTDGNRVEHMLNLTERFSTQTSISDITPGEENTLFGCTSTYDEVFDNPGNTYEGGHLFSFNTSTRQLEDFGIISKGQGLNCMVVDSAHQLIYMVTYPAGHLFSFDLNAKT